MSTIDINQLKLQLDTRGYCFVHGLLPLDSQIDAQRRLQRIADNQPSGAGKDDAQLDASNQYLYGLVNHGKVFVDMVVDPTVMQLVAHVIGREFLLSSSAGVIAKPNGSLMPLHSDQWWMPNPTIQGERHERAGSKERFDLPGPSNLPAIAPAVACTVMWMVSPFTEDNGATRIVPGSHLCGAIPEPVVPHAVETIPATGEAGTVLIWDARLWHATGANRTHNSRYGVVSAYCGPQFRQMENFPLLASDELLESRPDSLLKALLGFKVWNGYGKLDSASVAYINRPKYI